MNARWMRVALALTLAPVAASLTRAEPPVAQPAAQWDTVRIAGGGPDHLPALESNLNFPAAVAASASGELLILARDDHRVYAVSASGELRILVDEIHDARDLAADPQGNLYVADGAELIKINLSSGERTFPATWADSGFLGVDHVSVDPFGNVYVSDEDAGRVGRLDADGTFHHVAGVVCPNNVPCVPPLGDGGPAVEAGLITPGAVAVDSRGNVYIADRGNLRVRRVDAVTGIITTYNLFDAEDLLFDAAGNLLFVDGDNPYVYRVDRVTGRVTIIAGAPQGLRVPTSLAPGPAGSVYLADPYDYLVRRLDASAVVQVVAGNGTARTSAVDSYPATQVAIELASFAIDAEENVYFCDAGHFIRRIDAVTGIITTFAGTGEPDLGDADDGALARDVRVTPGSLAVDSAGNVLFASSIYLMPGNRIRRIDRNTGRVQTLAGGGTSDADGIPATQAQILAGDIELDSHGNIFFNERLKRVRFIDVGTGLISTLVGGGSHLFRDGIQAREVSVFFLRDLAVTPDDALFVSGEWGVARLDRNTGALFLAAGGGDQLCTQRECGPVPATGVNIVRSDTLLAADTFGSVYFVEEFSDAVRRIDRRTGWVTLQLGHGRPLDPSEPFLPVAVPRPLLLHFDTAGNLWMGNGIPVFRIYRATPANRPPLADARPDSMTAACTGPAGASVLLDGSGSSDPDSNAEAGDDIALYDWYLDFGQATSAPLGRGPRLEVTLPFGSSAVTLQTIDRFGARSTDTLQVTVTDDDRDGDGVRGCVDNCPELANAGQYDVDGNGVGDACDACLADPSGDFDGDGVCTLDDNCAQVDNVTQSDGDADGIGDACDVCPGPLEGPLCLDVERRSSCVAVTAELGVVPDRFGWVSLYGSTTATLNQRYDHGALPQRIDIGQLPDGAYKLCITASSGPTASLLASTSNGQLYSVDTTVGQLQHIGTLPGIPAEIELRDDPAVGFAATARPMILGRSANYLFDAGDGAQAGAVVPTDRAFDALEFIGSALYASGLGAELFTLDPSNGETTSLGPIDGIDPLARVRGLAYQPSTGEFYALAETDETTAAAKLYRLDFGGGPAFQVGSTVDDLDGLEFGSDGMLYSVHANDPAGGLYRIDPETAATTFVGSILPTPPPPPYDRPSITSLALRGSPAIRDCVTFDKHGETVLALNGSCGLPQAQIAPTAAVECSSPQGGTVMLDGSASSDPNATPGTSDSIASYEWYEDLGQASQRLLGSGPTLSATLPLGSHAVSLIVTNHFGESDIALATVIVVDTTGPLIAAGVNPATLARPDGRLVPITATVTAQDACGGTSWSLTSIEVDEPSDPGDIVGADYDTADRAFLLRATRSDRGDGRVYTITWTATDGAGNSSRAVSTVTVPYDVRPRPGSALAPRLGAVRRR